MHLVTREAPSRPIRLGHPRRMPKGVTRAGRALSLDTEKELHATSDRESVAATLAQSFREWEWSQRTSQDERQQKLAIQKELLSSMHAIWQKWARQSRTELEQVWWEEFERARAPLRLDQVVLARHAHLVWLQKKKSRGDVREYVTWLETAEPDETPAERYERVKLWLKAHKATGANARALLWERRWLRLNTCQSEWIGYRPVCCAERSPVVAVPVGCNGRLCPLCSAHRSQRARVAIKKLFDRLEHPILITLTCPNLETVSKHDFKMFRFRVRKFLSQHKWIAADGTRAAWGWIKGGVYSLETTFNRTEKTWHLHAHVLCDVSASLPTKKEKTILAGERCLSFTALKLKLEFDWTRLWVKGLGRMAARNASMPRAEADNFAFSEWIRSGRENQVKVWARSGWRVNPELSAVDVAARTAWNREFRRVIDIRPVVDREGAAAEVLKYITKSADFSDSPEAVEVFYSAVEGARLIQTFGSWYGVNFEADFDVNRLDDWGEMKCACGLNCFEKVGVFYRKDVVFESDGKSYVHPARALNWRGTVPRPMIRAHDLAAEVTGDAPCSKQGLRMELRR